MTVLTTLAFPDAKLQQAALAINDIDEEVKQFAADLTETLYANNLIGMAATHVGVMQQLIVIDLSTTRDQAEVFINPKIIQQSGAEKANEAGIAIPGVEIEVERYAQITVQALTLQGERSEFEAEGLRARVLQHEIDQMNGVLFIDRISALKRQRIVKKILKKR